MNKPSGYITLVVVILSVGRFEYFVTKSRALVLVFTAMSFCCNFSPSFYFRLVASASHFLLHLLVHFTHSAPNQIYISIFFVSCYQQIFLFLDFDISSEASKCFEGCGAAAGSSAMIEKNWCCLYKFNFHPRTNPLSAPSANPQIPTCEKSAKKLIINIDIECAVV